MVHRVEHAFARVTLCAQPPGTRIRYDAARECVTVPSFTGRAKVVVRFA